MAKHNRFPLVSIIVINFNGKKFLKSCFDSIDQLNYSKNKLEIIMVDNDSADGSVGFVKRSYPKIKIIQNNTNNYCRANNMAIENSRGEFIALLNNDVKVDKRWLIELIKVIIKNKKIAVVGSKVLKMDGTIQNAGHISLPNFYWEERGSGKDRKEYSTLEEVDSFPNAAVLYRKKCFEKVGLFDEDFVMYGEDVDISFKLRKAGFKVIFVPKSIAYHTFHGTADEDLARFYIERNRLLFLAKYYPEKLSSSLKGSEYFTSTKNINYFGGLYPVLTDLILKLLRHHPLSKVENILRDLFDEMKKFLNYENIRLYQKLIEKDKEFKKTIDKINVIKDELKKSNQIILEKGSCLSEKEKFITYLKGKIDRVSTHLNQKINELTVNETQIGFLERNISDLKKSHQRNISDLKKSHQGNISDLKKSHQRNISDLKKSHQRNISHLKNDNKKKFSVLTAAKDSRINALNKKLLNLSRALASRIKILNKREKRLSDLEEEKFAISDQLRQKINEFNDELGSKDNILKQKDGQIRHLKGQLEISNQELSSHKSEIENLSAQLQQRMDQILIKDTQLSDRDTQIDSLKEQLSNLNQDLTNKINALDESNLRLDSLKSEIENLSAQLQQRMDQILIKNKIITERNIQISDFKKELFGIYSSKGYRFILRPSKIVIASIRNFSKSFWTKTVDIFLILPLCILCLIVCLLVYLFIRIEAALWRFLKIFLIKRIKSRQVLPTESLKISVVIPNFNGANLIGDCLASIYSTRYVKDKDAEVIVIDDGSTDNSIEQIRSNFPQVRIIRNHKNMKFGFTCNRGVREAKNELIVLLNNDIIVTEDFLEPILAHFEDEDVFTVTPKLYADDKKTFVWGMHMGRFQRGYVSLWNESETKNGEKIHQASPAIFAIGGAMIFRKSDFLWLGGFDEVFRPNSWEDIDISYRAWKRGLKVIYEPRSLMFHKGKATVTYERHKEIKNELIFTWKDITDDNILFEHFKYFPAHLLKNKTAFLRGFFWAVCYYPKTLLHRFLERRFVRKTDKEIFNLCMNYYRNFERNGFRHPTPEDKRNILIITPFMPYPLNAGGKIRIYTLANFLKSRYNFYLLTLIDNESEAKNIPELKKVFCDVFTVYYKTPMPTWQIMPSRYRYSYSRDLFHRLGEIQDSLPLDLIHIESNELLYLAKAIEHVPLIYTEHDISILTFTNSYYKKKGSVFSDYFDFLKRTYFHTKAYRHIDNVITLSLEDESVLKRWFPTSNITYIPTGVDINHFHFKPDKKGDTNTNIKRLIFVGHYPHFPNEDAIVYFATKIYPLIKKEQKVELLVVGSHPTSAVKNLAKDKTIKVIGTVDDVRPYLYSADVFVNPIRFSAGIKGKVLEAMSAGLPVVSTKFGSYGINARNNQEILIAKDTEDFANQVVRILKDAELRQQLIMNARQLVEEKYDWMMISQILDKTYEHTLYDFNKKEDDKSFLMILDRTQRVVQEAFDSSPAQTNEAVMPEELHMELTYLCNSKCIMCDLWDFYERNPNIKQSQEISLEEIKKFVENSRYLQNIHTVVLSGGEPFLRKDIAQVCGFFSKYYPNGSIGILSNCLDWQHTLNRTKEILDQYHPNSLWIGTSLDGLTEGHDKIRAKPGAFDGLKKTIDIFKQELPSVRLCTTFTLTPYNIDQLIPARDFAKQEGLDFFAQFVVPKEAREKFIWQQKQLEKIDTYVAGIIKDLIKGQDYKTVLRNISNNKDIGLISKIYYYLGLVKYQTQHERFFKDCIAGSRFAMFNPYGDLFFCPILKDKIVGNIREFNFDDLWASEKANEIRSFTNRGVCHCWLVCIIIPLVEQALRQRREKRVIYLKDKAEETKLLPQRSEESAVLNTLKFQTLQEENTALNDEEYRVGKIVLESFPQGIGIGAHYNCNSDCIFCFKQEHINFSSEVYQNFFERKLKDALNRARFVNFCGFGELLLMPGIEEFLDYVNQNIPHVNKILTTNGTALRKEVIFKLLQSKYNIQISLLTSKNDIHKKLTRADNYDLILKQIKNLVSQRTDTRKPGISLVFIINTLNIEDLPEFVKLAAHLGADEVLCNYMTVYTPAHLKLSCFFKQDITNQMIQQAGEIARDLNIRISLPPKFSDDKVESGLRCSEIWKYFYVETEGSVLPCCFAGNHVGYLDKEDFSGIWNGKTYQDLRRSLVEGRLNDWCKYCYKNNHLNINDIRSHVTFRPDLQENILKGINISK